MPSVMGKQWVGNAIKEGKISGISNENKVNKFRFAKSVSQLSGQNYIAYSKAKLGILFYVSARSKSIRTAEVLLQALKPFREIR